MKRFFEEAGEWREACRYSPVRPVTTDENASCRWISYGIGERARAAYLADAEAQGEDVREDHFGGWACLFGLCCECCLETLLLGRKREGLMGRESGKVFVAGASKEQAICNKPALNNKRPTI